jgi:hypothetical protein
MNGGDAYSGDMIFPFFRRRQSDSSPRPASEGEVLKASTEFARKEKLVDRFDFLPPDMNRVAKDTALSRFLEILLSHMRQ